MILTFTIISLTALLLNFITGGLSNRMVFSVYRSSPFQPLFYVRLFGHVFGHADWSHFSGNMITLLLIGPLLEEKYGTLFISMLIAITALVTGFVNILFFPTGLLGASGIVFAMIMLSSIASFKGDGIPLTFIIVAVFYFGSQIYEGIFVKDQVSHLTHILGGLIGCGFGFLMKPGNGKWR